MLSFRTRYSIGSAGAALAAMAILGPGAVSASPGVSPAASAVAYQSLSATVAVTHVKGATQNTGASSTKHLTTNLTSGSNSSSTTVGLWAADWGGAAAKRTAAGWQAAATNDSVLIGGAGVYKKWIPQLKAWNPNVTILEYNLGPYLQKGSANYQTVLADDPSWFARDSRGNLINLPSFPNNYLMDPSNAGYRAWHASQLAASVAQYGFDGAMDDSMGAGPLGHYASGTPVDTATGQPYTAQQWLAEQVLMLNQDKAALNGKYLAFNGLVSGPMYVRESSILATSNADAGVSELFLRQPNSSVTSYPNATALQDLLQMMSDMAAHGKTFLGWTKVWSSGTHGAGLAVGAVRTRCVPARKADQLLPGLHALAQRRQHPGHLREPGHQHGRADGPVHGQRQHLHQDVPERDRDGQPRHDVVDHPDERLASVGMPSAKH